MVCMVCMVVLEMYEECASLYVEYSTVCTVEAL